MLTIGKYAEAAGVSVETVRFYQRRELIGTPSHAGGMRRYGPDDLRRLRFIRHAQTAGFTLEEIRELLGLDAGDDRARVHALAAARIVALDAKIAALRQARDALARLADDCAGGAAGPCPILGSFGV